MIVNAQSTSVPGFPVVNIGRAAFPKPKNAGFLTFHSYALDVINECLWRGTRRITLTPKAFAVLRHLAGAAGALVTKEQLLEAVWPGTFVSDSVLKVCVREIRRALCDQVKSPRFIETQHRRGYRFIAPLQQTSGGDRKLAEDSAVSGNGTSAQEQNFDSAGFQYAARMPETRYARSGSVNIAYQVFGDGPVDIVFVMGWVSHLEYFWTEPSFARFLRRLASFSRVILFDKRGTGLSDRVPDSELPTLEQRMDDVRAVMDAAGSRQAVICGVSEGGVMSALFAATYPSKTRALVMIGTYAKRIWDESYPWAPTEAERERFYSEILNRWGGPVGLEDRAPSAANDPRFREWWAAYLRMGASPGAALALTRMNTGIDARHVLESVRVPTLVLHRSGDRCMRVEEGRYVASLVKGSRFVELPGVDHLPFVGDQDSVLDEIEEFVAGGRAAVEVNESLSTIAFFRFFTAGSKSGRALSDLPASVSQLLSVDLKREIEWFRGCEARGGKDGPFATFDGPARAIASASAIAERAAWFGLAVGAGLHTGECVFCHGTPSGVAVNVAAQIASQAAPGEILVSNTVRDLVAGARYTFSEQTGRAQAGVECLKNSARLKLFKVQRLVAVV